MSTRYCVICDSYGCLGAFSTVVNDRQIMVCAKCAHAIRGITDDSVRDTKYDEFVAAISHGVREVVINTKKGVSFNLSTKAQIEYCERLGIHYVVKPRTDRHSNDRFGSLVEVDGDHQWWRDLERDDATLIDVVKDLKNEAEGYDCNLRVIKMPADVDWVIEQYNGEEWIAEKHRIWF